MRGARQDDLTELPGVIWRELELAARTPGHSWRTPLLATAAADGTPNARIVILRRASAHDQVLDFYTDRRSPKVRELQAQPQARLVFWNHARQWQLRVLVRAVVADRGPVVDELWARIGNTPAASDYMSVRAPGDSVDPQDFPDGYLNYFALVRCSVVSMDWLELARTGHRRALLDANHATWVQP